MVSTDIRPRIIGPCYWRTNHNPSRPTEDRVVAHETELASMISSLVPKLASRIIRCDPTPMLETFTWGASILGLGLAAAHFATGVYNLI